MKKKYFEMVILIESSLLKMKYIKNYFGWIIILKKFIIDDTFYFGDRLLQLLPFRMKCNYNCPYAPPSKSGAVMVKYLLARVGHSKKHNMPWAIVVTIKLTETTILALTHAIEKKI